MFIRPVRPVVRPVLRPAGAPLLRGLLVAGTAYAAARSAAIQELREERAAPAAPAAPPASGGAEFTDRLAQLGEMAQEGLLTPEEFAAAKARLLGI